MNTDQSRKTSRMTRMALVGLSALTLFAATAAALPLGLSHQVDTPAGSVAAAASEQGADTCIGASVPPLPALPAVPSIPLPLPVALPAVPAVPRARRRLTARRPPPVREPQRRRPALNRLPRGR